MAKKKLKKPVKKKKVNYTFWFFINALLAAIFIYGIYRLWKYDWTQGLSIIVFDLLVILILKIILKFRRR